MLCGSEWRCGSDEAGICGRKRVSGEAGSFWLGISQSYNLINHLITPTHHHQHISVTPQSCELIHTSGEECEIDCFHCVT